MLTDIATTFESHFGFPVPSELMDLLGDETSESAMPVGYRFPNERVVLEIQYLRSLRDPKVYDVKHNRLSFAVTTDGFELLVDLGTDKLEILQNEHGDIDSLGITIEALLNAERFSLRTQSGRVGDSKHQTERRRKMSPTNPVHNPRTSGHDVERVEITVKAEDSLSEETPEAKQRAKLRHKRLGREGDEGEDSSSQDRRILMTGIPRWTVAALIFASVGCLGQKAEEEAGHFCAGEIESVRIELDDLGSKQKKAKVESQDPTTIAKLTAVLSKRQPVEDHKCGDTGTITFQMKHGAPVRLGILAGHSEQYYEFRDRTRAEYEIFRVDRKAFFSAMEDLGVPSLHEGFRGE